MATTEYVYFGTTKIPPFEDNYPYHTFVYSPTSAQPYRYVGSYDKFTFSIQNGEARLDNTNSNVTNYWLTDAQYKAGESWELRNNTWYYWNAPEESRVGVTPSNAVEYVVSDYDIINSTNNSVYQFRQIYNTTTSVPQKIFLQTSTESYSSKLTEQIPFKNKIGDFLILGISWRRKASNEITIPVGWKSAGIASFESDAEDTKQVVEFIYKKATQDNEIFEFTQTVANLAYFITTSFLGVSLVKLHPELAASGMQFTTKVTKPASNSIMLYGSASAYYGEGRLQTISPDDIIKVQGSSSKERLALWFDSGNGELNHTIRTCNFNENRNAVSECLELLTTPPSIIGDSTHFIFQEPYKFNIKSVNATDEFWLSEMNVKSLLRTYGTLLIKEATIPVVCTDVLYSEDNKKCTLTLLGTETTLGVVKIIMEVTITTASVIDILTLDDVGAFNSVLGTLDSGEIQLNILKNCDETEHKDCYTYRDSIVLSTQDRVIMPVDWMMDLTTACYPYSALTIACDTATIQLGCLNTTELTSSEVTISFFGYSDLTGFITVDIKFNDLAVYVLAIKSDKVEDFTGYKIQLELLHLLGVSSQETGWIDAETQILTIDFSDPEWKMKLPDRFIVEDGSIPFYVDNTFTYDGKPTFRSGNAPHNGRSESTINITTIDDGMIEFNYTDSSEGDYDKLRFSLDGTELFTQGNMSGWKTFTKTITKGTHKLNFAYTRDSSGESGKNACAIGYIKFSKVAPEFKVWYLVKSENSLYTIVDGAIQKIEPTVADSVAFREFGIHEIPTGDMIKDLTDPIVLAWSNSEFFKSTMSGLVTATPFPQTFESPEYHMTHDSILGIEKILVVASESTQFAISVNNGVTWVTYTGTEWAELSEGATGMSASTMTDISSEALNALVTERKFKFRVTLVDETSTFTSLIVDYLNPVSEDPLPEENTQ